MNSQIAFDLLYNKTYHDKLEEILQYSLNSEDQLSYYNLGWLYFRGIGLNKNIKKAEKWYLKSTELGNSSAMNNLGYLYYKELKDYKKAEEWYLKSAEAGNTKAMNNLAFFNKNELKDYKKTEEWYLKSAELGNARAMNNLGHLYNNELKDNKKAKEWYLKAAELNNISAIKNLACMYFKLERYSKALEYFEKITPKTNEITNMIKKCLLETRTLKKIYNNLELDVCAVCLEHLKDTKKSILIRLCGHAFHYECIKFEDPCYVCRN
jgi:TPR repeat protein